MKIVIVIVALLVMLLGMAWVLAYFQVVPAQKMANKTPAIRPILVALRVAKMPKAKHKPKASTIASATVPPPSPAAEQASLDSEKSQLDTEKQQLDAEKAVLDKKLGAGAASTAGAGDAPAPQTDPKVISIYSTMKADKLALIFAKLPDSAVAGALEQLDDRQAGKVLAALPNGRAAKLTVLMSHLQPPTPPTATNQ